MLDPQTVLQGRYSIVRLIASGGMGAVYEAVDTRLDAHVAIKETLFTDSSLRKQFEREARLLARLHHPALPLVSDHFTEDAGQFLVMQYVPGDDLGKKLKQQGSGFTQGAVLEWGDQLLDALDYLHMQAPPVLHRDIKPQNLKVTSRGQIILLDFGLAKGLSGIASDFTLSKSVYGYTPNYAPPEQIQGVGTDAQSDLYSLAATLYHLATGLPPIDALTRSASVLNDEPDPLRPAFEINPAITHAFSDLLLRSMALKRSLRPATAAQMREELRRAAQGRERIRDEREFTPPTNVNSITEISSDEIAGNRKIGEVASNRTGHSKEQVVLDAASQKPSIISWDTKNKARRSFGFAILICIVLLMGTGFYTYYTAWFSSDLTESAISPTQNLSTQNMGGASVSPQPSTPLPTPTPDITGTITGEMAYPSEGIPKSMVACAENIESKKTYCTKPRKAWEDNVNYKLRVPAGKYFLYAKISPDDDDAADLAGARGYYTEYMKCGMKYGCGSKERIILDIHAGKTLSNILVGDFWN